jgi:hypothetical protein
MKIHSYIQKTINLMVTTAILALSTVSFTYAYERNGYYCHYYNHYNNHYYYHHHHYYHDNNNFAAGLILGGVLGAIASSNQMQPNMPYPQPPNCRRVMVTYYHHDHKRIVREPRTVCN